MGWIEELERLNACPEALDWIRESGHKSLSAAWTACPRPSWMLWLLGKAVRNRGDRAVIVRCACAFAREVIHLIPEGEDRPRAVLELAERWATGEDIPVNELRAAADAAAVRAAAADAALRLWAAAADAAVWAADAAGWAVDAAARAADAADAAANAAANAAAVWAAGAADAAANAAANAAAMRRRQAEVIRSLAKCPRL